MNPEQKDIFEEIEEMNNKNKPYRNAKGEVLPWEEGGEGVGKS